MNEIAFLPNHARVTAADAAPSRWMLALHGLLGSGGNLRGLARRLVDACPDWGFVLVDLRMHGASQSAPPPHTIAAATDDLIRLEEALALPMAGVLGHSFGGKIALAYLARRRAAGRAPLAEAWILEASPTAERAVGPGRLSSMTAAVLGMLRAMPQPLPSRERFFEIIEGHGMPRSVAEWLAMSLRQAEDGLRLRIDFDAIDALTADYLASDLWHVLEQPSVADDLHVIMAGQSNTLDDEDRARLAKLPHVHAHLIPAAGHWVHVDAPDEVFELVRTALPR
jgi:esterase